MRSAPPFFSRSMSSYLSVTSRSASPRARSTTPRVSISRPPPSRSSLEACPRRDLGANERHGEGEGVGGRVRRRVPRVGGWAGNAPRCRFPRLFPPPASKFFSRRAWVSTRAPITTRAKSYGDQSEIIPVVRVKSTIRNPACLRAQMDGPSKLGAAVQSHASARVYGTVEVRTRISRTETERLAKSSLRRDASRSLPRGGVVGARPAGRGKNLS